MKRTALISLLTITLTTPVAAQQNGLTDTSKIQYAKMVNPDMKSTRLNSSHTHNTSMPSYA